VADVLLTGAWPNASWSPFKSIPIAATCFTPGTGLKILMETSRSVICSEVLHSQDLGLWVTWDGVKQSLLLSLQILATTLAVQ
jgi:hypothetical protein